MNLLEKLKKINWINYYIIGPDHHTWEDFKRNPFYGLKQLFGVKNKNPKSIIDLRIGYKPWYLGIGLDGVRRTNDPLNLYLKYKIKDFILFELRKPHVIDGLYYNGFITFLWSRTNGWWPWFSLCIRYSKNYYATFGIGWEGVVSAGEIAEFGFKFRPITRYKEECKWNPGVVAPEWFEGHI